ncbi:MAG TPA: chalcone isomerase family protein [Thermoanaerobaculia bacterium]
MGRKLLAVGLSLIATVAYAAEVAGVKLPDSIEAGGKTLKFNGAGLRKKVVFKVYVAGLYLENPTKDAAAVLSSDQIKSMRLHILRTLDAGKITEAITEGFERNSKAQMGALKARLDRFNSMFPDVVEGDEIVMSYLPGKGTVVTAKGAEKGTIEGKDFADALFAVWLGSNPVQEDLKKALLGG